MDAMKNVPGRAARRAGSALIAAALAAIGLQCPAPAQAEGCKIQRMELPVKMVGRRAIATVGINGTDVPLIVDSGAFFSFLTPAAAEQLHLSTDSLPNGLEIEGLAGRVKARMTTVDHLQVVKGEIPHADFIVGGNEEIGTMGLLGRNILALADVEFDLAHGAVRIVIPSEECDKTNMAYWAGDKAVAELALFHGWHEKLPAIRAEIKVNDHTVTALFDTGATTMLSLKAARKAGVKEADLTPDGKSWGAGTDKVDAYTAPIDKVDFGGEAILHNRLEVSDFKLNEADMLVGIDFFLSHRVYVSRKQQKMFFTYNGGPVFMRNVGGRADTAAADAADTAASEPGDMTADAYARRGEASLSRGDLAGALADLDRACALDPKNADHFWARARAYMTMKQVDKARADIDTTLQLAPAFPEPRLLRAGLREHAHERALALEDLDALDKSLAPQSDVRRLMAELFAEMRMPARSLAEWNQWMPAHRNDIARAGALNSRCWDRVELDTELDKALDDCDDAVDLDSKNASFHDSRGWAYLRLGKPQKAVADFDRALEINPKHAWSLYGRGQAKLALGEADRGQADLAAARKERPTIDKDAQRDGLPLAPSPAQAQAPAAASAPAS